MQAEDGRCGGLGGGQLSAVDGVDDGARVAQLDARAHAIAPTSPPVISLRPPSAKHRNTAECFLLLRF
jgi:hypothetical protein